MKIYVAGPMTGRPQFNIPMFDRVAAILRGAGYEVVTPSELDTDEIRAACLASPDGMETQVLGQTWGDFLARDVKLLADTGIDTICLLPGWTRSRGARLECYVGLMLGLNFMRYYEDINMVQNVSPLYIAALIGEELMEIANAADNRRRA